MPKLNITISDAHAAALAPVVADRASADGKPYTLEDWIALVLRDHATQADIAAYASARQQELLGDAHARLAADIDAHKAQLEEAL